MAVGSMVKTALEIRKRLAEEDIQVTVINGRFVCPLDTKRLDWAFEHHDLIVTMEENVLKGGFGEAIADDMVQKKADVKLLHIGVPDVYVEHGGVEQLKKTLRIDADSIIERIKERL